MKSLLFPLVQTLLSLVMFLNWYSTKMEFSFSLWTFGFISGIALASWVNYFARKDD